MLSSHDINRRHSLNTHFFDTIHNEEQAYWLGFLWADGSWSKTAPRCGGPNRLTLSQKLSEINHLQLFLNTLKRITPSDALPAGMEQLLLHTSTVDLCA